MNHVNMQLLFAHVPYTRGLPKQLVSSLVWNGQQGVQIFFAVSGFLITATSLRRWKSLDRVSVADFYRLRFARIAPLLLGLLAVLSVLHLAHVQHFVVSPETGGLGRALVAALTFHVNLAGGEPRISAGQLGYFVVALGGGDVLFCVSMGVPVLRAREAADRAAAGVCGAGAVWALGADAWQSGVAGVFVSRRHGCDRDGMPDGDRAPWARAFARMAAADWASWVERCWSSAWGFRARRRRWCRSARACT